MKKKFAAIGMAALMTAASCFPAQAVWVNVNAGGKEAIWRYTDNDGNYEKNVLRISNGQWFWIGEDGYLDTGHEGKKISIRVNGIRYILTLNSKGKALEACEDEAGNPGTLSQILGSGVGSYAGGSMKANSWWQVKKTEKVRAWKYNDESKKPLRQGVHEIDGKLYYFDKDGEMKTNQAGGFVDGYYRESMDYSLPVNHWIPYREKWVYCGEDGRPVTGVQTVDGVEYDFGEDGFLTEDVVSFPLVTSVELGDYPEEAFVGDVVEIPFTIQVMQKVHIASPSNAEFEVVEADYDMFKSVYAVGDQNKFNIKSSYSDAGVDVTQFNHTSMRYQYDIDWDKQVIRVPIMNVGLVYGTMRVDHQYDTGVPVTRVLDEDGFKIRAVYQDMSDEAQVSDVLDKMEEGFTNSAETVDSLKCLDNEVLTNVMMDNSGIMDQLKALDYLHSEDQNISTYIEVKDDVKEQIDTSAVKAVGLGLSGEKNKKIGLHVAASKETMPEELKDKNAAAFDLKVMQEGREKNELDIPLVITVPKPKTITGTSFELYHIHDGETEEVSYNYDSEEKTVTFAADSFSTYVFVQDKNTTNHDSGSNSSSSNSSSRNDDDDNDSYSSYKETAEKDGAWVQDANGWWFRYTDGTYPAKEWKNLAYNQNNAWYHFDAEGYLETGWFRDTDGRWYYLNPNSDGTLGSMLTGWRFIDGYWYYFNERSDGFMGALVTNGMTPDGYMADEQGRWVQ